jgi:surface protein
VARWGCKGMDESEFGRRWGSWNMLDFVGLSWGSWNMLDFVGLSQYYDQVSSFCLLLFRVDCQCNRPCFLATVFHSAYAFNGDVSRWDVAKVTNMGISKSIYIVENEFSNILAVVIT